MSGRSSNSAEPPRVLTACKAKPGGEASTGLRKEAQSRQIHGSSLRDGAVFLEEALTSLNEGQVLELVAESLRSAHTALGDILRPMSADDLLGEIFSEFCIGK